MADNTTLNSGTGGDVIMSLEATFSGDTAKAQLITLAGASGSEGSWTLGVIGGDATNGLDVDVTRVSGTVTVGDGGSTISIDDGGGAITVDGTVSVTGVATSANQTTMIGHLDGVEGLLTTIDADTGSIAGAIKAEDSAHSSGDSGIMMLAVRQDSHSDLGADGDYIPPTIDAAGGLRVSIVSGAGSGGTSATDDADFTQSSTSGTPVMGVYESSVTQVTAGDMGIVGITEDRELKVSVSSGGVSGKVDDAAFTAATDEGVLFMAVASSDSVDSGDAGAVAMTTARALHVAVQSIAAGDNNIGNVDIASIAAGNNNIGDVDVASIAAGTNTIGNVGLVGRTTGGLTIFRSIDLDESEEEVKATAGQLYFIHAMNLSASVRYLKFYNATAANVTVGTTTPVLTFALPTLGDTNGAGFTVSIPQGLAFGTAITAAATTGLADNDTGAPGANEVVVNLGYT